MLHATGLLRCNKLNLLANGYKINACRRCSRPWINGWIFKSE